MDPRPISSTRRKGLVLGSLLLAAGLAGCSSAGEPAATRAAIAGGAADTSHDAVFLLIARLEHGGGLCTATLIAPNLLLTARHCVSARDDEEEVLCGESDLGQPHPAEVFIATNAPTPQRDSPFFRAAEVRVPEQGGDTCGYDIALIILEQNVPSELSVPAVPRIDREVAPGEPYTAVGYGVNENGEPTGARMRREGLSVVCEPGTCGAGVESTEFLGDTGICSGDSGGPALDADGKVVGVVSRGGADCSTPIYGTVTAWRQLLTTTAADAARFGGYEAPFWVTTGKSDPPALPGTGGEGGGPSAPGAGEGEPCSVTSGCAADLVCYAPSDGEARCVPSCEESQQCSSGRECRPVGEVALCLASSAGGLEKTGCAIGAPSTNSGGLTALLALGLLGLRRRARSAH